MDLATLGTHVGVDLWNYRTADGRSIRQAVDFLVPYAAGERTWAFDQITPFSASTMHTILRRGAVAWKEPKYSALAARVGGGPRLVLTIPLRVTRAHGSPRLWPPRVHLEWASATAPRRYAAIRLSLSSNERGARCITLSWHG